MPINTYAALPRFQDVSLIPNHRLTEWFYALQHARNICANSVERNQPGDYTYAQLSTLDDLLMNIGMARDAYLASLGIAPEAETQQQQQQLAGEVV